MKNILLIFICVLPLYVFSQSPSKNFIKTKVYRVPYNGTGTIGINDTLVDIGYFDGLGRPLQTIAVKAGGQGQDIVTPVVYDGFGRQIKTYLPYADPLQAVSSCSYHNNEDVISAMNMAYQQKYPGELSSTVPNPYTLNLIELSVQPRTKEQFAPGLAWQTDHSVKYEYQTNSTGEVRLFKVGFPVADDTEQTELLTAGFYHSKRLYKSVIKDENWTTADGKNKTTEEFKDMQGHTILKRNYNNNQPHDTYYVYDDFGNLTYVIPPLATDDVVITTNHLSQGGTNFPWTRMALVDQQLADDYDTELSAYDNEEILNLDLVDKYGGQGGFSVSANNDGNVTLTMNITVSDTLHLRTGIIADISALGTFKDQEIGKIEGPGYGYYFLVANGKLEISGKGTLPMMNLNATLAGGTPLEYSKNYAWTKLAVTDPLVEADYDMAIGALDNNQILSTYTTNSYGARGGIAIGIDEYDTITVSLNITSDTPLELQAGTLFALDIYRRIPDRTLGTVTGTYNSLPYSYTLSLVNNALQVTGSGQFTSINFVDTRASSPTYEINQSVVEGLCYIYHYDKRNRVVEKKIPGKGWEHMVYDRLDRVILTQDANLRTNTNNTNSYWLFSKYDKFDRVIYTGQITDTRTRKVIQDALDAVASPVLSESRSATGSTSPFQGLTKVNYTNQAFPTNAITFFTISYYDDYSFDMPDLSVPTVNFYGDTLTTSAKGLLTGTRIKALAPSTWSNTLTGYNDKGQPIWSDNRNAYFGTENISDSQLDFTGKPVNMRAMHKRTSLPDLVTVDHFDYDDAGRMLKQNLKIGNNVTQLIRYNKYDELGQLESKKVGNVYNVATSYNDTAGLQKIDYTYNIRGWLKGINNSDNLSQIGDPDDLFAFGIKYNTGPVPLYNGNIAETYWKSKTDNKLRSYNYEYDALNRLTSANYVGNYTLAAYPLQTENYKEGPITYDKAGNIKTLERWGLKANNEINKIDVLSYSYFPQSNQLRSVNDTADANGFNNKTTGTNDDYSYDANGNLKKDLNKGYGTVTGYQTSYNYMNLPLRVSFSGTKYITYVYDATGVKLEKKVTDGGTVTTTQYDGGYVYVDGGLQYFPHSEGYVNVTAIASNGSTSQYARFEYIYQYKDHLGSVRLSYLKDADTEDLQVIEESNYYAFGMKHAGYNNAVTGMGNATAQKVKYQEQERQDELGLNWDSFKWRNYDYAIGRFMCIDPLAEKYVYNSPYAFQENKMGMGRELEGLELAPGFFFEETIIIEPMVEPVVEPVIEPAPIELAPIEINSDQVGFWEGIGNWFGDTWDSIFNSGESESTGIEETPMEEAIETQKPDRPYAPNEPLRRGGRGNEPKVDEEAVGREHTQLGTERGSKGDYTQGRQFDKNGNPVKDVDHTDHGRPAEHPDNPHQHDWEPNPTGGTPKRGDNKPLKVG